MKTVFWGDICPTAASTPFFEKRDAATLFTDVAEVTKNADFAFCNVECAFTESDDAPQKIGPSLKGPVETAAVLREIGVTCAGLANNHCYDYGHAGIADTLEALARNGIAYTGFGNDYEDARKNYYYTLGEETLGIVAVCEHEYSYAFGAHEGARGFDVFDTLDDVRDARKRCDRLIVVYHGGKEFCAYPSPRLRKVCHAFAKAGADAVLCQHSHCIGTYENVYGCHIVYGQGNSHFVWPELKKDCWHTGLVVTYDTLSGAIGFLPVKETAHGITQAKGTEKAAILDAFFARSARLSDGSWLDGWHEFCESETYYGDLLARFGQPDASARENEICAHYLDCEAHNDVYRELYKTAHVTGKKFE